MSGPDEKELNDLEKLLAALPPRPATLHRDHLLFRAGQLSMRRSWAWPLTAIVMSFTTVSLVLVQALSPAPEPVVRVVMVTVPQPAPVAQPDDSSQSPALLPVLESSAPAMSYWRLEQQALRFGVESLPSSLSTGEESPQAYPIAKPGLSAGSRPGLFN